MPSSNSLPTITTVLTAALLLLTSVTSGAKEVKPPLFPDGLKYLNPPNLVSSQVVPKLVRVLPSDVPAACYSAAASPEKPNSSTPNCAVSDLEVLEVTYPDCEEPWIMCRCSNANISRSDMMRQFGGLSPNLRGAVKNVIVFKAEDAASGRAYARNQEVIFFGDVFDWTVFTFVVSSVYNLFGGFSKTPEYQRAVHEDTCAADSFAASVKEGMLLFSFLLSDLSEGDTSSMS